MEEILNDNNIWEINDVKSGLYTIEVYNDLNILEFKNTIEAIDNTIKVSGFRKGNYVIKIYNDHYHYQKRMTKTK